MSQPIANPAALQVLPFFNDAFTWQRFERFCLAVARATPGVVHAERYGKTGEAQLGIDIVVELEDGRTRTIQCRLRKRFTKSSLESTVRKTTYPADEHEIWVTCDFGKAVSDGVRDLDGWKVESADGISQIVRALPRERARRIVEDAFGAAVRRAFVGPQGPIAFDTPGDFFVTIDAQEGLIRHDLALVGRRAELGALREAVSDPVARVVVQPGRGGIGKTRLLRALAEGLENDGRRVLFARPGVPLDADAVDDLPMDDIVVIVDDAHRPDVVLGPLLAAVSRRSDLTVVLGARPAGVDVVTSAAADAQLDVGRVAVLDALGALAHDDVVALAEAASGQTGEPAHDLADATGESPLVTVIAGGLLARGRLVAGGERLRETVLSRFSADQLGRVTAHVPADAARKLATLVAALQPLNVNDDEVIGRIAVELEVAASQVRRWLGDLEAAGLVLAAGRLRRVTPDVLADQLLLEACVDRTGRPTGYADELWVTYAATNAANLLANLAELDWRPIARGSSPLEEIWSGIERKFRAGDAWTREQILEIIDGAAYLQPERALEIVRVALGTAARTTDWGIAGVIIDDVSVRQRLPRILRAVAQHPRHAAAAMAPLWELARDDARRPNAFPDHPLRVFEELASYRQTAAHRDAVLDLVERERDQPDVDDHVHLPTILLEPLLAREGTVTRTRGRAMQLGSYVVDAAATRPWRDRVRALLVDEATHGSPRRRVAAVGLLGTALDLPHGYFNVPVDPDVRDSWRDDQLAVLEAMGRIEAASDDVAVRDGLVRGLSWHAEHDPWPEAQQRAAGLLGRLAGPDEELVAAITRRWDLRDFDALDERDNRVAARLLGTYERGKDLAEALERIINDLIGRGVAVNVDAVLWQVFRISRAHARDYWAWAVAHPEARLAGSAGVALDALRRAGDAVDRELHEGWTHGEPRLQHAVALYLQRGAWFADPSNTELDILKRCVSCDDPAIQQATATTLLRFQRIDPRLAARLALVAKTAGSDDDTLFLVLQEAGLSWATPQELDRLVERLVATDEVGYGGWGLLADVAALDAERWLAVWRGRLGRGRENDPRYRPVPFREFDHDQLGALMPDDRRASLGRLLALAPPLSRVSQRDLGSLFWMAGVPGFDDIADNPSDLDAVRVAEALEVFSAWALNEATDVNSVRETLLGTPWQLAISEPAWVAELLDGSWGERRNQILSGLHGAVFVGSVYGDSRLRLVAEGAAGLADALVGGSPAAQFYAALARTAEDELRRSRERDAEFDAGWG